MGNLTPSRPHPKDECGSTLLLYAFCGNNPVNKYDYLGWDTHDGDDSGWNDWGAGFGSTDK